VDSKLHSKLSHIDEHGAANMVDVSDKDTTQRIARARARISMQPSTLQAIADDGLAKGEVLGVARIAGIQAAKRCSDLIPLCHPLPLNKVTVEFSVIDEATIEILTECRVTGRTGVEMEALTAASISALTIYDMCKAIDKAMTIESIQLIEKQGGKSGHFKRD
jgi:cyclic pyranopterin phosphate synthase